MRVAIVPSEGRGWIVGRICEELSTHNEWEIRGYDATADFNLFITYFAALTHMNKPGFKQCRTGAWFTHPEGPEFFKVADLVGVRLCHAPKYARLIGGIAVQPGIDSGFQPQLVVGISGRSYPSMRKGENLIHLIDSLPYVQVRRAPSKESWSRSREAWIHSIRDFYLSIDVLVVTSSVEGGPMAIAEALACGTPVIAPNDVGNSELFPVRGYQVGDWDSLRERLEEAWMPRVNLANRAPRSSWQRFSEEVRDIIATTVEGK